MTLCRQWLCSLDYLLFLRNSHTDADYVFYGTDGRITVNAFIGCIV